MADYLAEINDGLIIEEPKILLPWNLQKKGLFDIVGIEIVNENYYTLRIVLSGLSFVNCAGLHFENDRLSEIDLFNNEKCCSESELKSVFNAHQSVLENIFGNSRRNKLSEKIWGVNAEYKWKFGNVTIIHKLWDRFGIEETLKIYINR